MSEIVIRIIQAISEFSEPILFFVLFPMVILGVAKFSVERGYNSYSYLLFFCSYIPLYPILIGKTLDKSYVLFGKKLPYFELAGHTWSIFAAISTTLLEVAILYFIFIFSLERYMAGDTKKFNDFRDVTDVANEYILVYIYPLLVLNYAKLFDIVTFLIVFLTVAIIQVRTERYLINPLLVVLGFRFFYAEQGSQRTFIVSRQDLTQYDEREISQVSLGDRVAIHTRRP